MHFNNRQVFVREIFNQLVVAIVDLILEKIDGLLVIHHLAMYVGCVERVPAKHHQVLGDEDVR